MKLKQVLFLCFFALIVQVKGQDIGRVIIKNAKESFPKFIVSLNGIRLSNDYSSTVTFNYLDEFNYKVNILQAGSRNTLQFMVYSQPNYISTYIINKDSYGNYLFGLESKVMMGDSAGVPTKTVAGKPSTSTVAATPAASSVTPGTTIDEEEYYDIVKTLKKETIEKNRLEMAMTFFGSKWFLSSMVRDAMKMFNLEASRVTFAKFMYARTVDKQNYFKVFDAFTLSKSKKDMNEFIKTNP